MSLERVVVAPFQHAGTREISEQEFVVALSLHRDWYSPSQAKRVIELATSEGLIERTADGLVAGIDPTKISIPNDFVPDEGILTKRTVFDLMLERLVAAGCEKRDAVAEINRLQRRLNITIEAAAAMYAIRQGVDVSDAIDRAITELSRQDSP